MYSAALLKESFLNTKRLIKEASPRAAGHLDKCNKELLVMKRACEDYCIQEHIDGFVMALNRLYGVLDDFLDEYDTFPNKKKSWNFILKCPIFSICMKLWIITMWYTVSF